MQYGARIEFWDCPFGTVDVSRLGSASLDILAAIANTRIKRLRDKIVMDKADIFIMLGVAIAFALGVYLFFSGEREQGIFAATWVPAILAFGIYLKLLRRKP